MKLRFFVLFAATMVLFSAASAEEPAKIVMRAQRGDKDAYLAMAEGYRYGRNGFEKSLTNARYCYELYGADVDSIATQAYEANREDEFGLMFRLLETMRISGLDKAITETTEIHLPATDWAQTFNDLASNRNRDDFTDYVVSKINSEASADECNVALMFLYALLSDEDDVEPVSAIFFIAEKVPYYYNWIGEQAWEMSAENPDALVKSLEFFKKANDRGMLLPANAAKILKTDISSTFSDEEIANLRELAAKN